MEEKITQETYTTNKNNLITSLSSELNDKESEWLLDWLNSNYFKSLIKSELKRKLEATKGVLDSYHNSDDLYFCDREREDVEMAESILSKL